jgi:hypothetical protein
MKKNLILFIVNLFVSSSVYSQRLYDNGPLTGDGNYVLQGAKWNKTTLNYYIYNTSSHLTSIQREFAIAEAFKIWSDNSVLNFVKVSNPNQADLKIKWATGNHGDGHPFDGNSGVLAHAYYPPPAGGSYAGELHFDDDESWSLDGSGIDLITVAAHEIGHLLGIEHSTVLSALMYPYYSGIRRYLDLDDKQAVWELYGYPCSISGPSSLYNFQQGTYVVTGVPAGKTITWSGSSNVNIISGQGTSQVTISTCGGDDAILTVTLSDSINPDIIVNKYFSFYQHELTLKLEADMAIFSTSHPYAQCFDWYIGSDFSNSGQFNCYGSSINVYPLSGHTTGTVSVRAKSASCYTSWQEKQFYLWTPEIGTGYYNPLRPEPFYANLVENIPNYASHADIQFYWYFDNTLFDITDDPYIESHEWTCGEHQLRVVAKYDGYVESYSSPVDFWGMCRSSYYSAAYPNPAGNELIIDRIEESNSTETAINTQSAKGKLSEITVLLYSHSTAKIVYEKTYSSSEKQIRIDTSKLPNGVYYLNIISNGEKVKEQTIIVNH